MSEDFLKDPLSLFSVKGKTAVITGATGAFGAPESIQRSHEFLLDALDIALAKLSTLRSEPALRDPRLRHPLRRQPPDQRPVLQSDHSPIVECSLFTAESVQFSSAADTADSADRAHSSAVRPRSCGDEGLRRSPA